MRKLFIVAAILVILSGLVALALRNLSGLINRNKDYLLARAQQTLGRQVTVGDIGVTLWGGIGARVSNFALADDLAFSQEKFLQSADLQVDVEFFPLFWKELRIKRFILHQPILTIVRDAQGRLNIASLGGGAAKEQPSEQTQQGSSEHPPSSTPTALPLVAALLNISDGIVHYIDQQQQTDFRATQLDLTVTDFSSDRPFHLDLNTALFAERQNLKLQSRIGPLGPTLDLKNLPVTGALEIQSLALRALPQISRRLPQGSSLDGSLSLKTQAEGTLGNLALTGTVDASAGVIRLGDHFQKPAGTPLILSVAAQATPPIIAVQKATLQLHTLELTSSGTINLEDARSSDLKVDASPTALASWKDLLPLLNNYDLSGQLEAHARVQEAGVTIENVSLQAFGGSVQGKGRYAFQPTRPQFTLTSQARGLNLTEVLRSMRTTTPQQIEGQANIGLTLEGSGSGWEEIKPSLQGKGQADVLQGAILNMNIAEGVLSGVSGLPGLSVLVSPRVRERYPEIFATKQAKFDELHSVFTINNSKVHLDDLKLSAADYAMQGTGWLDFNQTLDLQAQLVLSQKLSTDIVQDVKAAQYMVNKQSQIEIPFTLAGTFPKVQPRPDMASVGRLLQQSAVRKGTEELEKRVLKKFLPFSR